ncbi:MAG: cell division protein ZapA [Balneolaceae bacterium]
MQSIKVNILGKQIPLKVNDDEVESMKMIANYVDDKFRTYRNKLTNQPDSIVMILAALTIAEELFETRRNQESSKEDEGKILESVNDEIEKLIETL